MKTPTYAVLAATTFLLSAPAIAGEWKGTTGLNDPQRTPIHDLFYIEGRPSICAFSGLNDEFYLDEDPEATRTQSYGTLVANGDISPAIVTPGTACNKGQGGD
jgi:hypothetical protein